MGQKKSTFTLTDILMPSFMGILMPLLMGILMLSISKLTQDLTNYYLNLAAEDYFLTGGEPEGIWLATKGRTLFGLSRELIKQDFQHLIRGESVSGEPLVRNVGHPKRQVGWDCTFSPPKDFSVLWSLLPHQERIMIQQLCEKAVTKALRYLEEEACITRRGQGGCRYERAYFLAAGFAHCTNRDLSVQYHIHAPVLNLAIDANGKVTAIHSKPLYRHQIAAGVLFQKELARCLEQEMGIKTLFEGRHFVIPGIPRPLCKRHSTRRDAILHYMERKGDFSRAAAEEACLKTRKAKKDIPPRSELLRQWQDIGREYGFSTNQALKLLYQVGPNRGTLPDIEHTDSLSSTNQKHDHEIDSTNHRPEKPTSDIESHRMVQDTTQDRDTKQLPQDEIIFPWERKYTQVHGNLHNSPNIDSFRLDDKLSRKIKDLLSVSGQPRIPRELDTLIRQYLASDSRMQHRTERQGQSLLSSRRRRIRPAKIEAVLSRYVRERNPLLEELRYHFTEIRRAAMKQKTRPIDREQIKRDARVKLNRAHAETVRSLVSDRSRLSVLRHKSAYSSEWVLRVSREAWERAGYEVLGTSLTRQRVREMQARMGIESMTLRTLELKMNPTLPFRLKHATRQMIRAARKRRTYHLDRLRISKKTILIVDAADTLNMSQMAFLIGQVKRQGGKIVLAEGPTPTTLPNTAFDLIARQVEHNKNPTRKASLDQTPLRPDRNTQDQRPFSFDMEV